MNIIARILIFGLVVLAVAGVFIIKANRSADEAAEGGNQTEAVAASQEPPPKLLDLGSNQCVPCKKMEPILAELKREYAGVMDVEVIDVRKFPAAAKEHAIRVIPTQIFLTPEGVELFRHEGFYGRDAILAKWSELGYELSPAKQPREG